MNIKIGQIYTSRLYHTTSIEYIAYVDKSYILCKSVFRDGGNESANIYQIQEFLHSSLLVTDIFSEDI